MSSTSPQRSAFQQNGQLPSMDHPALTNISPAQLAEIARLFQIGALTVPPAPGATETSASYLTDEVVEEEPGQQNVQSMINQNDVIASATDKEEGEVEEMESESTPEQRSFSRAPPSGPRNGNANVHSPAAKGTETRSTLVTERQQPPPREAKIPRQHGVAKQPRPVDKEYCAKAFILEMVRAGKTYDDLAPLVTSSTLLAKTFKELKLPAKAKQPAQLPNDAASIQSQTSVPGKPRVEQQRKVSATKRPAAPPVDRNEYLARLQAAKNKKSDSTSGPTDDTPASGVVQTTSPKSQTVKLSITAANSTAEAGKKHPLSTTKPIDRNALLRERLEALKALQAAKQNGLSAPTAKSSPPQDPAARVPPSRNSATDPFQTEQVSADFGTHFTGSKSQQAVSEPKTVAAPHQQPAASSASSFVPPPLTPTSAMGGLPGLFLGFNPSQSMQTPPNVSTKSYEGSTPSQTGGRVPLPSAAPFTISRKRPVASDFDDGPGQGSTPKRPFGQSRTTSEDESLVIEVSDDEDDDEMEMGDMIATSGERNIQTTSFRDVGPLRDFPQNPSLQNQSPMPSTPGSDTPGGVSYQQKVKDIEVMRRKIAEMEAKKKALGQVATSTAPTQSIPMSVNTPPEAAVASVEASFSTPDRHSTPKIGGVPLATEITAVKATQQSPFPPSTHSRVNSSERPVSATTLARQQEKERLRKRLLELEQDESADLDEAVEAAAVNERTGVLITPIAAEGITTEVSAEDKFMATSDEDTSRILKQDDQQELPAPAPEMSPELETEPAVAPHGSIHGEITQHLTPTAQGVHEVSAEGTEQRAEESSGLSIQNTSLTPQEHSDVVGQPSLRESPSEEGELSDGSMSRFYGEGDDAQPKTDNIVNGVDAATPEVDMDIDSATSSEDDLDDDEVERGDDLQAARNLSSETERAQALPSDADERTDDLDYVPDSIVTENDEVAAVPLQQAGENQVISEFDGAQDGTVDPASGGIDKSDYEPEADETRSSQPGEIGKDAADAASSDAIATELAKSQPIGDDVTFERQPNSADVVPPSAQVS